MPELRAYRYIVTVEASSREEAERVLAERLSHDEDYGFEYRLPEWEPHPDNSTNQETSA